ncbi:LysR family transcriptional regulator [Nocardioides sp. NPDC101246]|uniref:LysR family transcriptional regulator n=1 Tax=Nocardioides sp. NPDC101246 TaxID=3364336 RepID=UPI00380878FC
MELREIEIFLALADELHFGRTAERLHVSQARVSQVIKAQERRIGGALFARTSRTVTLTPLGERLRDDLRPAYDAIQQGLTRAADSVRGVAGVLRLGVLGIVGIEIRNVIDAFVARYPEASVSMHEIVFSDPFTALRDGGVDLILVWKPVHEPDLTEGPVVLTEGRVLAVWAGHELAERESVSMEDFGGRVVVDPAPPTPETWIQALLPRVTPGGRPILRGPAVATFHEVLTRVAARECVSPLNEHARQHGSHPGVVLLPVHDAPTTEWVLAWRTGSLSRRARAFVDVAASLGPRRFGQDPIDKPS